MGAEGQATPRSSSSPRRGSSTTTRRSCSTRSSATGCSPRAASTASGPRTPRATTSCSRTARASRFLRQQADYGDSRPNRCLADYVAPVGRPHRRVRGLDPRRRRARRPLTRRSTTTTARSWPRPSPTVSRRRSPSTCTSARAASGATSPTGSERGTDRGALPRDPPGVRLPGLPRPLARRASCSTCSTPSGRDGAHGDVRDVPAASVSGLYFHHPEARYFSVGRIGRDQVEDYAARKGSTVDEVERWLAPNLAYAPAGTGTPGSARYPDSPRAGRPRGVAPFSACGQR